MSRRRDPGAGEEVEQVLFPLPPRPAGSSSLFADIALPVPLPDPLTYEVPAALVPRVTPGVRVRVGVGRRRLTGVVVEVHSRRPEGVTLKPIEEVLDRAPVLPGDLLGLARFTAEYYRAPLGEVFRTMLPAQLPPWGDRRVWLTDAGALAPPRSPEEATVIDALREGGRMTLSDLQSRVGLADLDAALSELRAGGRIAAEERGGAQGARYISAVELAPGDPAAHRTTAGRSAPGKAVIDYLAAIGRPATIAEVVAAVECTPAVVRRLVSKGVLRQFTQVERLSLDRHRLTPESERAAIQLRPDQDEALSRLIASIEGREFNPFLLRGMTGAGKTEVYLRAAEAAVEAGRSVILLVPEIALVPALAREVERRFGEKLAILHSGLGTGERHQEWERVRSGEAKVVLGPRSALFAPVPDLGFIVIDEEQDPSYKQEITPRYHARDLALVRARNAGATPLLVSATPSLESRYNIERGKLGLLTLTTRAGQGSLPEGILVDLRQEPVTRHPGEVHFSERLKEEIKLALAAGDQIILLRNRRGYAPMLLCRACGEDLRCPDCGLPRTYHRRNRRMICHYCGSTLPVPERCPVCQEEAMEPVGAGTERVEERFIEMFPEATVDVLDRDTARRPGGLAALLERFGRGEVQVLIGTQMVSKGHHFPGVALTAVLAADAYLSFPDFRAVERTYNLLTQLAGRAGRGERPGRVVIQTYHPEHYAIQAALRQDDEGFAREEMRFRRVFHYPPYTRMVQLLMADRNRERGERRLREVADDIYAHPLSRGVRLSGPAPAPLERLRGEWRFQLLLRSANGKDLHRLLDGVLPDGPGEGLTVDVDPQQLL